MTDGQKRIAIARELGAECWFRPTTIGPELVVSVPDERGLQLWIKNRVRNPEEVVGSHYLPEFLTDLNLTHEMEGTLDENQWRDYGDLLVAKIKPHAGPGLWNHRHIHATAAQRAEAFIVVKGLAP